MKHEEDCRGGREGGSEGGREREREGGIGGREGGREGEGKEGGGGEGGREGGKEREREEDFLHSHNRETSDYLHPFSPHLISALTSTLFLVLAICVSYRTSIHYKERKCAL